MSNKTKIAWTHHTWNPWRGCTKIDPGCRNCYMFTAQERYGKDPHVVTRTKTWGEPRRWQKSATERGETKMVFTCSWSDWFHHDADNWRDEAWEIIRECPNLTFQILTKRAERIADYLPGDWDDGYPNVWLGVSISEPKGIWRADELREVPAHVRFISYEPALASIAECVDLTGIHWLIYGGESGPGFRPEDKQWARDIRTRCRMAGTAFFHKQSSGPRTETGIELDGEIVREFPITREPITAERAEIEFLRSLLPEAQSTSRDQPLTGLVCDDCSRGWRNLTDSIGAGWCYMFRNKPDLTRNICGQRRPLPTPVKAKEDSK